MCKTRGRRRETRHEIPPSNRPDFSPSGGITHDLLKNKAKLHENNSQFAKTNVVSDPRITRGKVKPSEQLKLGCSKIHFNTSSKENKNIQLFQMVIQMNQDPPGTHALLIIIENSCLLQTVRAEIDWESCEVYKRT
jgi:hypothetical protein